MDAVGYWSAEHAQFARLLVIFERQLERFRAGDEPDYELMRDVVQYLRDYADCFHHPREDVAFDILVQRAPEVRDDVQRLQQEHHDLAESGALLLERLRELVSDAMIPRGAIEKAASDYLTHYRSHIDTEENGVMPVARRVMTEGDWKKVLDTSASASDPLFGDNPAEVFRELRRQLFLSEARA